MQLLNALRTIAGVALYDQLANACALQKKLAAAATALQTKTKKLEEQRAAAADAEDTIPEAEARVAELQGELDAAEEALAAFRLTIQDEVRHLARRCASSCSLPVLAHAPPAPNRLRLLRNTLSCHAGLVQVSEIQARLSAARTAMAPWREQMAAICGARNVDATQLRLLVDEASAGQRRLDAVEAELAALLDGAGDRAAEVDALRMQVQLAIALAIAG